MQSHLHDISEKDQNMIIPKQRLQELRHIRIVTKNYAVLRGLRGVPFGLLFLLMAAFELRWLSVPDAPVDPVSLIVCIIVFVFFAVNPIIDRYYDHLFGSVQQASPNTLDQWVIGFGFAVLVVGGIRIDMTLTLPISATGLVLALMLLFWWWRTNAFRTHLLVLALITAFLSVAPLAGFTAFHTLFLPRHGGYELVFGVLLTVGSLCDHLLLLRTFRQTQRVYHDKTV